MAWPVSNARHQPIDAPARTSHVPSVDETVSSSVTFTVVGMPKTKGSTKSFLHPRTGRIITTSDTKGLRAWEQAIAYAAREHAAAYLGAGIPVRLEMIFRLPRPKRLRTKYPVTRPDYSKLWRAAEDALTRVLFADDGQVVSVSGWKLYADPGDPPSVEITVSAL